MGISELTIRVVQTASGLATIGDAVLSNGREIEGFVRWDGDQVERAVAYAGKLNAEVIIDSGITQAEFDRAEQAFKVAIPELDAFFSL